ncbi:MAG: PLP-dependent transferase, partial [Pirellula sp.]
MNSPATSRTNSTATIEPKTVATPEHPSHEITNRSAYSFKNAGTSTTSVHAGEARQKPNDAITDSICCSSTYTFESTDSILKYIREKEDREEYGRYGNPNEKVVERKLAALDHAEDAIIYSSG